MKKICFLTLLFTALLFNGFSQIDKILGKWKTIDDEEGTAKSIVYIYKATNDKYYGRIDKLFKDSDKLCEKCEGANKNKPILGMIILNGMTLKDNSLTGGTILDPKNGKVYHCNISYDAKSKQLKVRGSLDKSGWLGRNQTWIREE